MRSCGVYSSVPGFSCLAQQPRFIHAAACAGNLFLYMAEEYSSVWKYHCLFTRFLVDMHLDVLSLYFGWIKLLETFLYKSLCGMYFHYFSINTQEYRSWAMSRCRCLTSCETTEKFSQVDVAFYTSQGTGTLAALHPCYHLMF